MKFVLACYGTRGDVEPCAAVGRELLHRGHDVHLAVSPDLVGFAESAGLAAVAHGPDLRSYVDAHREFYTFLFRNFWRIPDVIRSLREFRGLGAKWGDEVITPLMSLADGADLLLTGLNFEERRPRRRRVLRHSFGHTAFRSAAGQRQAPSLPSGAAGPLCNDGVRVAGLARGEEAR